ncbi:replication initiator protein A [Lentilactobacillus hilgardii]|uniref:replication initiator protein A n=1 Tax=Lentilactobacillus hilgardii TaxID=1588 RepID=UPI0021C2AA7E|nr:replication initiator protein A [Lentilactobacillus hilgardii]
MFIKVEMDYFKDSNLKGANEILTYSLLCDRMKASKNNKDFFDKKFGDSYIIFKREELAEYLDVTVKTVTKILKSLVKKGYLIVKHQFNAASKLFLPKFENEKSTSMPVKEEITPSFGKNLPSNKSTLTDKYITDNTDNTSSQTISLKDSNITQKPDQNKVIKQAELDVIANSLVTKVHLPKQAVNIMKTFSFGDPKKLYAYAGLLFKAKSAVSKQAKSIQNAQEALSFELNTDYQETLDTDLKRIIVSANKKTSQPDGYLMTSLIDMFQNKVNDYCSHSVQSVIG